LGELGQLLREAREKKGLSIAKVEEETRIRQAQIEALEEESYEELPAGIYRKGLIRNYALYLGVDLKEVMTLYGGEEEEAGPTTPVAEGFEPPKGMTVSSWLFIDLFLGVLIVASIIVVGILAYNHQYVIFPSSAATPTQRSSLASPVLVFTATNTPSPTSTPTAIPSGRLQVDVEIIARTWLEVTVDGDPAFRGLIEAGTNWSWFAQDSIAIHVGNAGGVLATLNGQDLGALGEQDEVVDIQCQLEDGALACSKLNERGETVDIILPSGTPLPGTPTITEASTTSTTLPATPVITATLVLTASPTP
jgi:cytoskeleton protein RodZ